MPVGGAYDQRPEAGDETGPVQQGTCNSLGKKGWHWCSCVGASYSGCLPRPSGENIIIVYQVFEQYGTNSTPTAKVWGEGPYFIGPISRYFWRTNCETPSQLDSNSSCKAVVNLQWGNHQ